MIVTLYHKLCFPVWPGLNVEDLTQRTLKFFGPGSEYDTPVNNPYREKGGRENIHPFLLLLTN